MEDVPDSTDWLLTPLKGLAEVEAALRCQVCKDFYKTPMLTSCNHTFCSVCIRRALNNDGKCPLCRAGEQEMRLRSNWSMEEVVAAFTKSRTEVLVFATKPTTVVESIEAANGHGSPKRPADLSQEEDSRGSKRLRTSARLSKSRGAERITEMARQEADVVVTPSPVIPEPEPEPEIRDGLVACPICLSRMKETQVDKHLDTSCPGSPQPQYREILQHTTSMQQRSSGGMAGSASTWKPPGPQPQQSRNYERLPAVNYSMYKDQALRKKLSELGLSTIGPRQMLEKRHKEWMTIWNANCDSQYPRARRELMHDLDDWERTQGSRAPTSSRHVHLGAQIKDKDFDQAAWATQHENNFKDLIANARRSRSQAQKPNEGKSDPSTSTSAQPTVRTDVPKAKPEDLSLSGSIAGSSTPDAGEACNEDHSTDARNMGELTSPRLDRVGTELRGVQPMNPAQEEGQSGLT
jgi:E3 ubiquitin-protein ligase RAD18